MDARLTVPVAERLDALRGWVDRAQPRMTVSVEGGDVIAAGRYDLRSELPGHPEGAVLSSFDLRLVLPPEVGRTGPEIFETGERIPRVDARHVDDDGCCCICVYPIWRATARDRRYIAFLDDPLRNFLIGQVAVEEGLDWPFGEYRHGSEGAIQAASEFLGCEARARTVRDVLALLPHLRARGRSIAYRTCPCGTGRVLERCCFERLHALSLRVAEEDTAALAEEIERHARKLKGLEPRLGRAA